MDSDFFAVGHKTQQGAQDYVAYLEKATHNGGQIGEVKKTRRGSTVVADGTAPGSAYEGAFKIKVYFKDKPESTEGTEEGNTATQTWDDVEKIVVYDSNNPYSNSCGVVHYGGYIKYVPVYTLEDKAVFASMKSTAYVTNLVFYYNAVLESVEYVVEPTVSVDKNYVHSDPRCCKRLGYVYLPLGESPKLVTQQEYTGGGIDFNTEPCYVIANHKAPFVVCATYFNNYPMGTSRSTNEKPFQTIPVGAGFVEDTPTVMWLTIIDGLVTNVTEFEGAVPYKWKMYSRLTIRSAQPVSVPVIEYYDEPIEGTLESGYYQLQALVTSRNANNKDVPPTLFAPYNVVDTYIFSRDDTEYYRINGDAFPASFIGSTVSWKPSCNIDVYFVVRHTVRRYGEVEKAVTSDVYYQINQRINKFSDDINRYEGIITNYKTEFEQVASKRNTIENKLYNTEAKYLQDVTASYNSYLESLNNINATYIDRVIKLNAQIDELNQKITALHNELSGIPNTPENADRRESLSNEIKQYNKMVSDARADIKDAEHAKSSAMSALAVNRKEYLKEIYKTFEDAKVPLEEGLKTLNKDVESANNNVRNAIKEYNEASSNLEQCRFELYGASVLTQANAVAYVIDALGTATVNMENLAEGFPIDENTKLRVLKQTPTSMDIVVGHLTVKDGRFEYTNYNAYNANHYRITPYLSTRDLQDV